MGQNERTLKMIEEYVKWFEGGETPAQIAKRFGLSDSTVYRHLSEIAEAAGRSRESLLVQPHKSPTEYDNYVPEPWPRTNLDKFRKHRNAALGNAAALSRDISEYVKQQEMLAEKFQEEEDAWQ